MCFVFALLAGSRPGRRYPFLHRKKGRKKAVLRSLYRGTRFAPAGMLRSNNTVSQTGNGCNDKTAAP